MKKVFFFSLSFLFFLSLLQSCQKDPNDGFTIKKGKIVEKGTLFPMSKITVFLMECKGGFDNSFCFPIDTLVTDVTGVYQFKFIKNPSATYEIVVENDPSRYYSYTGTEGFLTGKDDWNPILTPVAWVRVNVRQTSTKSSTFYVSYGTSGTINNRSVSGTDINESSILQATGNDSTTVSWTISFDNEKIDTYRRIFTPAKDTTQIDINF